MTNLIKMLQALVMIAVVFMCFEFGLTVRSLRITVSKLNPMIADADSAVKRVNLLEKQSEYLIQNLGLTANQVRAQSLKEGKTLDILTGQVQSNLVHLDALVVSSAANEATLTASTNETIKSLQPVIAETHTSMVAVTSAVNSLDIVIKDPAIPATLKATQKASEATADAAVEVKGMAIEGHQWLHSLLHPTWPTRVYHVGLDFVHAYF